MNKSHNLAFASRTTSLIPIWLINFASWRLFIYYLGYILVRFYLLLLALHLDLKLLCSVPFFIQLPLGLPHLFFCLGVIGLHAGNHGCKSGDELGNHFSLGWAFCLLIILGSHLFYVSLKLLSIAFIGHIVVGLNPLLYFLRMLE